jgi:nucleotide-binding universal stress UspA family protein
MYRRILVPVDGSAVSTLGLRHAIELAKSQRARLRVLNVVDARLIVPALG